MHIGFYLQRTDMFAGNIKQSNVFLVLRHLQHRDPMDLVYGVVVQVRVACLDIYPYMYLII
jgi:hypothetical protein